MFVWLNLNVRNVLLLLVILHNIFILLSVHRASAGVRLGSVQAFLLDELGVQEHQTLVHNLEGAGHALIVLTKLGNYVLSTLAGQLNEQTLRGLHVVGSYK